MGLQSCKVTGLQSCRVTGLQSGRVTGLQSGKVAGLQSGKETRACRVTGVMAKLSVGSLPL